MQEHTWGQSFLNVTYLDGQLWTQISAVDLDDTGVALIVAPDGYLTGKEMELSTSLEVETLILLNGHQRNLQKIWATWDISLEI